MGRFRPWHGILLVVLFLVAFVSVDLLLSGDRLDYQRVSPDAKTAQVRISVGDLEAGAVRFFRFLNTGNQEVHFFIGRDRAGALQVGFDANEICFKRKRGYQHDGEWLMCRVCEKSFRLAEVNAGAGGCAPVPLRHRIEGDQVILTETDVLEGWRLFR